MTNTMKHSGIPWIGDIPNHWEVEILKFIFEERNERSVYGAEMLLSLSQYTGVKPKAETDIADSHIAESYEGYKIVREGDFVMNIMLAWNGSYAVSNYDGMISPAYCVFKFRNDKYYKRYYHYLLRTEGYPSAFKTLSRGIMESRLRLYPEQFYTFPTIVPPLSEQKAIADYLDKHCAEVDEMVSLQEKIIEELRAYRQAIITETVTRGLNPNAPMKDSGVEWIGQIPQGWEVKRFKDTARVKANLVSPDLYPNLPQVAPDDIEKDSGILLHYQFVKDANIISDNHLFYRGQIIYSKIRPMLNKAIIAPFDGLCSADMYPIETNLFSKYLLYFILSTFFTKQVQRYVNDRVKMPKINKEEISTIITIVPPLPEQQEIADYLDKKTAEIDQLIAIKQRKIEELKEYKKSLIYEYVTGKKQPIL